MSVDPSDFETAVPADQLRSVIKKYKMLWQPEDHSQELERIALPELFSNGGFTDLCSPEQFHRASASFAWATASSYDGFHPKHWAHLGPRGTIAMAAFVGMTLAMGCMPSQLQATLSVLLPKVTPGFRIVGLFPSLYRVVVQQQKPTLHI